MEEDKPEARVSSKKGLWARSLGSLKRERSGGGGGAREWVESGAKGWGQAKEVWSG